MRTSDFLKVNQPAGAYQQLRDAQLLRDEIRDDDPSVALEQWLTFNEQMEKVAQQAMDDAGPMTAEQEDLLASGKAGTVNLTDMVSNLLTVDTKPFSFKGREYLRGIYDYYPKYSEGCKNIILIASRQVEKSTTQSAKSIALGLAHKAYKTLYIAPTFDQVQIFSQQRFKPMCEDSGKLIGSFVQPAHGVWQVKAKQFQNGSFFNFRSCYLNADNARGISANHLLIDEIQDIAPDAIPVLEQCQAHSEDELKYRTYAGTPKSSANIISLRWEDSCKFQWLTKCSACNFWNMSDESIIQDDKYACAKCGNEIVPHADGMWVPEKPSMLNKRWGFRLSQLMVPFKKHKHIIEDRDNPNVSRAKYLNETLGLPYDEGENGITDTVLEKACKDYPMLQPDQIFEQYAKRGLKVYAGVDYGTGEGSNPSFTVLTIGAMQRNGIFKVLYMHKFKGRETESIIELDMIDKLCRRAGVSWLGADWGHGAHQNARLERERGWDRISGKNVIMEFKYVRAKKELTWNGKHYHADRNQSMGRLIDAIRECDMPEKGVTLFRYDQFGEFKNDLTTIYMEYNTKTGTVSYQHQLPDDGFHSINYAYMAARQGSGMALGNGMPGF